MSHADGFRAGVLPRRAGRRLTRATIVSALRRSGRRRNVEIRADQIQAALRAPQLEQRPLIAEAFGASAAAYVAMLATTVTQNGKVERLNRTLATEWAYRQPSPVTPSAPPPLPRGPSTTALDAATQHSADVLRSAGWHQPDGRVQLAAGHDLDTAT